MFTARDCLKAAWKALLEGDLKERDNQVSLARNILAAKDRIESSGNPEDIIIGEPIKLKDNKL